MIEEEEVLPPQMICLVLGVKYVKDLIRLSQALLMECLQQGVEDQEGAFFTKDPEGALFV